LTPLLISVDDSKRINISLIYHIPGIITLNRRRGLEASVLINISLIYHIPGIITLNRRRGLEASVLITKTADLSNSDYIIRTTYKDRQLLTLLLTITILPFTLSCSTHLISSVSQLYYGCVCHLFNKRELS